MNLKLTVLAAAVVLVTGATTVIAAEAGKHDPIDAAIAYRKSVYHVIVWNFSQMSGMMRGKTPYDAADFAKRAERVAALSTQLEEGFIPNSGGRDSTEAKAEIWSNWDDFKVKLGDFERESKALAEVAKAGKLDDVKAQHAKVGAACKACHDKYKQD